MKTRRILEPHRSSIWLEMSDMLALDQIRKIDNVTRGEILRRAVKSYLQQKAV